MARGRKPSGMGDLLQGLGEELGAQLGEIIAQSLERTLASRLEVTGLARKLTAPGKAPRGKAAAQGAACAEPGCTNPILAKGLCRSHYYRARYQSKKGGRAASRR